MRMISPLILVDDMVQYLPGKGRVEALRNTKLKPGPKVPLESSVRRFLFPGSEKMSRET